MKHRVKVHLAGGLLIFGVATVFFVSGHAVPTDGFDRITVGMTEDQVKDIIRAPLRVRHDRPATTSFSYGGFVRLKWCTMEVYFGPNDRVTGKFHDH